MCQLEYSQTWDQNHLWILLVAFISSFHWYISSLEYDFLLKSGAQTSIYFFKWWFHAVQGRIFSVMLVWIILNCYWLEFLRKTNYFSQNQLTNTFSILNVYPSLLKLPILFYSCLQAVNVRAPRIRLRPVRMATTKTRSIRLAAYSVPPVNPVRIRQQRPLTVVLGTTVLLVRWAAWYVSCSYFTLVQNESDFVIFGKYHLWNLV